MKGSSSASSPPLLRDLLARDRAPLERILRGSGFFTSDEVEVALELIDTGIAKRDTYRFVVAEVRDEAAGYACFGHTPCTDAVYDLYWIAVREDLRKMGLGRALLAAAEERIREAGGRMLLVETASKPLYAPTRAFYERTGYHVAARVPDFYREGDDKVIYAKRLR